jgi:hypothetical protein
MADNVPQEIDNSQQWMVSIARGYGYLLSEHEIKLLLPFFRHYTAIGHDFGSAFFNSIEQVKLLLEQERGNDGSN